MKYIFDFDEVLFYTTRHYTNHVCVILEKAGVSKNLVEEYRERECLNLFSMKKMLSNFSVPEILYSEIMNEIKNFRNDHLLGLIKKLGKANCLILTYGEEEYQLAKIERIDIAHLFSKIIVTQGSKKCAVEEITAQYKDETVFFIDDQARHFENLDFKKCPNLKTILYTGQNIIFD